MGSLVCALLAPSSFEAIEPSVKMLNYGAVCVNTLPYMAYSIMTKGGVWGAHPTDSAMRSGTGYIGNIFQLPGVTKSVTYGPALATASPQPVQLPPAVLFDALHAGIVASTSKAAAAANVTTLLVLRFLAMMARSLVGRWLPGSKGASLAYGACA